MSFLVSPGVHVREIDLTNVVPAVATTIGAICLPSPQGPVGEVTRITSEEDLVKTFGKPNSTNFEWWFTASNFLQYSDQLNVVRPNEAGAKNACDPAGTANLIKSNTDYADGGITLSGFGDFAVRTAGTWGNSVGVSLCATTEAYETHYGIQATATAAAGTTTITVADVDSATVGFQAGDIIAFSTADASSNASAFAHIAGDEGNEYEVISINSGANTMEIRLKDDPNSAGLKAQVTANTHYIRRRWQFYDLFDGAPGTSSWATANGGGTNDEMHIVIYDTKGEITGFQSSIAAQRKPSAIEVYSRLSKNASAKTAQGSTNYYADVLFNSSEYVYWTDHHTNGTNWGSALSGVTTAFTTHNALKVGINYVLAGGVTRSGSLSAGEITLAYDEFKDTESLDVNLVLGGPGGGAGNTASTQDTHVTMITDLVELRKDCVGFVSPYRAATVGVSSSITQTKNVVDAFDLCPSSSYMVYDSGYKYMYDKYNDLYRYVPMNGDTAGLCANTDKVADPWFSPAGYNRGNVRGAIKLSYNPINAERDQLYRARINPVTNFPGQGVVLFGDKTALAKPSAFDRINVRRLFLVLEKAIATAAKYQLFEFNDEFTRAQFRNMVEPFLRDVQGRRGIFDFKVVADGTNNTGEVIDRNEFIGDIYIKPARSINFITLNFIAVRTGVAFSEVGG
tara:strand:+ start:5296 stop:7338 length:2043 start_codon:yes stop_codon:yes gene_type:complete